MIVKAMHYFTAGLLILAYGFEIQQFYCIAGGIMIGCGLAYFIEFRQENLRENLKRKYYFDDLENKKRFEDDNI